MTTKSIKDMTMEEFSVFAIRCFTVDVNDFGYTTAAELLIKLMKARASSDQLYQKNRGIHNE